MSTRFLWALGGSLLVGIAGAARADAEAVGTDLRAELAAVKSQIAQLQAAQSQSWLDQRRAEEVKTLIRDVLADADTRASLLEEGVTAGHDGKSFFLASEDGGFLLQVKGEIQLRYVATFQDSESVENDDGDSASVIDDENEAGFDIKLARVQFAGHIADPRLGYAIRLAVNRRDNSVGADKIVIHYDLMDGVRIWGGEDKAPLLREETMSSTSQLAASRSYVNDIFTAGIVQGAGLLVKGDETMGAPVNLHVFLSDGLRSGEPGTNVLTQGRSFSGITEVDGEDAVIPSRSVSKNYDADASDFALTGRVDLKLAGDWGQADDFTAWQGEDMAAFLGAAVHYEVGETGDIYNNNDFFEWTFDGSLEVAGFNVYGALIGMQTENAGNTLDGGGEVVSVSDFDLYGALIQGGYQIPNTNLEPFVRYEWIDFDDTLGSAYNELNIVTVGANVYLNKHAAKFTVDVVWALDAVPLTYSGTGLQADDPESDDQLVLRAQFQMMF